MRLELLKEALADPRAGLYFLAGFDENLDGQQSVLTVHAAAGMLGQDERKYITDAIASNAPGVMLKLRDHNPVALHEARSLAALSDRFSHDIILADPTKSFARMTALLSVVSALRKGFGDALGPILWEPRAARLVVVPGNVDEDQLDALQADIKSMVAEHTSDLLERVISDVRFGQPNPDRRYTPLEETKSERPAPVQTVASKIKLRMRFAALAAMIGFGSMASAGTMPNDGMVDRDGHLPGIAAFVDLTALGESAFGTRNPFKAAGGLRLYFGDTEALTTASFEPAGSGYIIDEAQDDPASENAGGDKDPIHIAYAE